MIIILILVIVLLSMRHARSKQEQEHIKQERDKAVEWYRQQLKLRKKDKK